MGVLGVDIIGLTILVFLVSTEGRVQHYYWHQYYRDIQTLPGKRGKEFGCIISLHFVRYFFVLFFSSFPKKGPQGQAPFLFRNKIHSIQHLEQAIDVL